MDRPILFSSPMVRALLDGRKTQTRRVIKPRGHACLFDDGWTDDYVLDPGNSSWRERYYPYRIGDRLWVREAWRVNDWAADVATFFYRANERNSYTEMCEQWPVAGRAYIAPTPGKWKPGIHMPRWASRIILTITDVRVQRLQEINHDDAVAEGVSGDNGPGQIGAYITLWDKLNAARGFGWETNPWIVAVSFTVQRGNIDQVAP